MTAAASEPATAEQPTQAIGLIGLTFVAVGGVIGSGWLFGPQFAAQEAGPAAIVAWVVGGVMVLLIAFTYAEVAAMLPVMGGLGRLPQFSHGNVAGMAVGWIAWIGYVTAAPIETQALLEYASNEEQFRWLFNETTGDGQSPLSVGGLLVAVVFLAVFTIVNAYGVRAFTRLNTPLTWFKIAVPIIVAVALLSEFDSAALDEDGFAPEGVQGIMAAVASGGVIFAFLGFRHALDLAAEARRPRVTVPLALTGSLVVCTLVFTLVQIGFVGAVSPDDLQGGWAELSFGGSNGPIAALLAGLGMAALADLVLVDAVVGPFGAGLVSSASTARLTVAVSRNGLFPRALQAMSARGVPLRALVLNAAVGLLLLLVFRDGWQEILTFNAGAIVLSMCLGPVTLIALRRQIPARLRPFRLPWAEGVARAAFIVVGLIVYWTGWSTMLRLSIPLVLGGLLFWWQTTRDADRPALQVRPALWFVPYYVGLLAITFAGNFGGGRGWLPIGWDAVVVAAFSLVMFPIAVWLRLTDEDTLVYIRQEGLDEPVRPN